MIDALFPYISFPSFLFSLGIPYFTKIKSKINLFESNMRRLIEDAKQGKSLTQTNLLTSLISSTSDDSAADAGTITSDELLGNMFIFMFAGHETTAGISFLFFYFSNPKPL